MHVTPRELQIIYQAITLCKITGEVSSVSYLKITLLELDLLRSFKMSEFQEEDCK